MKVILLQDVAKIGRRSEVVEVPDGYALNKLIPTQMAEPATPANLKRIKKMQADVVAGQEAGQERFEVAQKALSDTIVKIETEVNDQGHLFKAVNEKDIVKKAQEQKIDIDETMLVLGNPIKEVGEHEVQLISGDSKAKFVIEVVKK